MPAPTCPICRQPVANAGENRAAPFCSDRCRLVDLGRWLSDTYRIPVTDDEELPPDVAPDGGPVH
jgi:endogenous inhibitor of DNA gyrase (YacG/DUF329 family)